VGAQFPSPSRGRVRVGAVELIPYRFNDLIQSLVDVVVPEPDHPKSAAFDRVGASLVTGFGFIVAVLPTVELDHDAGGRAREVGYVAAYGHLPAELEAQCPLPQSVPEPALAIGRAPSLLLRATYQLAVLVHDIPMVW
jgi:hypothetical protein